MISVCLATYNGERFIYEQLLSIFNQTKMPDEVIICDDCSTDGTVKNIREFIYLNNLSLKWKLYINKENMGYPANFYNAISKSCGEIIFLSDQDDIWEANKIQNMVDVLSRNNKIQVLSCKHGVIDEKGKTINTFLTPTQSETNKIYKISVLDILKKYEWPGMTMAIRQRFIFELNSKYDKFTINSLPHDYFFSILAAGLDGFYFYDYIGVYHRRHEKNLAREEHRIRELIKSDRKFQDIIEYNKNLEQIISAKIKLKETDKILIERRLLLSKKRLDFLKNNKVCSLVYLYFKNTDILRLRSFINDLLLFITKK